MHKPTQTTFASSLIESATVMPMLRTLWAMRRDRERREAQTAAQAAPRANDVAA
jgi:hypothetical protein